MFGSIIKAIFGIFLCLAGFAIDYIYITTIDQGAHPLLLVLSLFVVGIGIFVLMRAGKSDSIISLRTQEQEKFDLEHHVHDYSGLEDTLNRNNAITSEWQKRNAQRDKMKMIQIAAPENVSH